MTDYQIQPHTRRCSVSGRELHAGERFFTALVEEGGHFQRHDFSQEAWTGPPPGTFSFWSGKVPPQEEKVRPRIDEDLLVDCFERLEGQTDPGRVNFRYVVALLLMRKRRFKFDEAVHAGGAETISVRCARTGTKYTLVNPRLSDEEMSQVQEEVFKVLGWN